MTNRPECRNSELQPIETVRRAARAISKSLLIVAVYAGWASAQSAPSIATIQALIRSKQLDQAHQATQSALKQKPSDVRLWTLEGIIFSLQDRRSDAHSAFEKALRISPEYGPALKGEVQILYPQGDKRAIPLLERILKADPNDQTAHEMLAVLEKRGGKCNSAIAHFTSSGASIDTHADSLEAFGYCLVQLKKIEEAVPVFQKLVELAPDRPYARYNLAVVLSENKQNEEALKALEPLLSSQQSDADVLSLASQAAEATKDTPRAVALLRQAIVQSPTTQDYYVAFATLCLDHDSYPAGIEMVNAGIARIPDSSALYISRGLLYVQLTEYAKAEQDFRRAEQLDANQSMSLYAADLAQVQRNNPDEALRRVRLQLKAHPESARLHFLLAQLLINNDPEPDSAAYREAMAEDQRALKLQDDLVIARDLLASIYMRAGQYDKAIEQCRAVLQHAPTDETAMYHLMISLRHAGKKDEAQKLVKSLADLHQQSLKNETDRKRYRLVIGTPPPVAPTPEQTVP
jgi:tetratricopeptide (TPR) repeat protein